MQASPAVRPARAQIRGFPPAAIPAAVDAAMWRPSYVKYEAV